MYTYPIKPDEIYHYGMPRRSGRYPWGSGDRPYQGEKDQKTVFTFNNIKNAFKYTYFNIRDKISGVYGSNKYVDLDGPYEKLSDIKKSEYPDSDDLNAVIVNSINLDDSSDGTDGRSFNCMYCSVAMVMRAKGYDVVARRSDYGITDVNSFIEENFTEVENIPIPNKKITEEELEEIFKEIIDQYDETYGIIDFSWSDGLSGHSMYYTIHDNEMFIFDGQTNKEYKINKLINSGVIDISSFKLWRLDKSEPKEKVTKVIVSRK